MSLISKKDTYYVEGSDAARTKKKLEVSPRITVFTDFECGNLWNRSRRTTVNTFCFSVRAT